MRKIKVSVIVPVYNSEKYLGKCLDSLINQTLSEIEIICVDDGSTDASPEILIDYREKDNRIKIFTQKNKDVGAARGAGVEIAKGKYIAFVDNDDCLTLDGLEKLYNYAEANNSDLVLFNVGVFYSDTNSFDFPEYYNLDKYFHDKINFDRNQFTAKDVRNLIMSNFEVWYKLYKNELFKKYDDFYFKEKITIPDVPLHVQVMLRAKRISFLSEHLYFYRRNHSESMLDISKDNYRVFDIFKVIDEVENFLIKNDLIDEYIEEFNVFKISQINYWFRRCGDNYKKEFFYKSLLEFNDINSSYKKFEKLPKNQQDLYQKIIKSNSYEEFVLLNKVNTLIKSNKSYKKQISKLKKKNREIEDSFSWKVTKPLRIFRKIFR